MASSSASLETGKVGQDILEKDYCPPLDTALFYAVLSDLDANNPSSIQEVRQILDSLKESAEIEQSTEFDPSGTTESRGQDDITSSIHLADLSIADHSGTTSVTEFSNPDINIADAYDEGIEELSDAEKINLILELCPEVSLFDIQFTLKKCKGSFRRSLDETLNLVWIKDNHTIHKSVDGFFLDAPRVRKRKWKNKSKMASYAGYDSQDELPSPQSNAWQVKNSQIDFIASRVRLSESLVRSEYHQAGGSQRKTILNLCKVDLSGISGALQDNVVMQVDASELGEEFPGLSSAECLALIALTYPFTARAHELAKAIFTTPTTGTSTPVSLQNILPHYARPQLDTDESDLTESLQEQGTQHPEIANMDQQALNQAAVKHAILREHMFSKANLAWRKSRSDRLMGGAAAYYSDESRRANATSRAYSSAAADAQVQSTATGKSVDLHGLNVQDAVRNAKSAVQRWWDSGQAEWAREGKALGGNGFTIITGAGTHSQGGKAKIRPAVIKMLKAEGWRIEEDGVRGQVIVLGRSRVR